MPVHASTPRRHSWPRLLVAMMVLAGAVALGWNITSDPARGTSAASPAPATASEPAFGGSSAPHADEQEGCVNDQVGSSPDGWLDVARGFGRTFTRTALGQAVWFSSMSSWLTDEQAAMYQEVPIEDIPAGTLQEVDVDDPGDEPATRGLLTYDTGMVLEVGLTYSESAGGWLVASITLADQSD